MKTKIKTLVFIAVIAVIFASCGDPEEPGPVTGVTLNKSTLNMLVGDDETLTPTITPNNAADKSVRWTSSSEAVATVAADGKVTAIAAGNTTITVTTVDGDKTADCAVTVTAPASRKFWAQRMTNNTHYQLDALRIAIGQYCDVWVEVGSGVTNATARNIANTYDTNIRGRMITNFSMTDILYDDEEFADVIEFASWWTDNDDGKLSILLLNIQDGANSVNDPYTEGYFSSNDFYEYHANNNPGSNYRPMIYIDTFPGIPGSTLSNTTLAHELQHLINYATTLLIRYDDDYGPFPMDIWIDEGLSAAAEWIYTQQHDDDKINFYIENYSGLIDKGNNFFVWDNHQENDYAILDDYATVYLFFQWLRIQAKPNAKIYYDIITAEDGDGFGCFDNLAVVTAAYSDIDDYYDDWELLLLDWFAANYINDTTGIYGYKNDAKLKNIKAHTAPNNTTKIALYPGEGVYSIFPANFTMPTDASNIKYLSINPEADPGLAFDFDATEDWVLLTYNADFTYTNLYSQADAETEEGTTTGVAASISIVPRHTARVPGIIRLDARDMLRRNGVNSGINNSRQIKR